jgi:hypothetical protein
LYGETQLTSHSLESDPAFSPSGSSIGAGENPTLSEYGGKNQIAVGQPATLRFTDP